jgi:hypothetical protein
MYTIEGSCAFTVSGAAQPLVPTKPDCFEIELRPCIMVLQRPKSDIKIRTVFLELISIFLGLTSLCTKENFENSFKFQQHTYVYIMQVGDPISSLLQDTQSF